MWCPVFPLFPHTFYFSSSYLLSHSESVPSVTFFILGEFQCVVLIGCQAELPECSSGAKPIGLCQSWRRHHDIMSTAAAGKRLLNQLGCIHTKKKSGGYWLSHIAHHLRPVTWHGSTRGLVQNKHFLSQFLDALSWMKQRFLCQNHCWKWPLMNQTLLLFPVIEMLLCYHPFIFCPACKACIVWHLMEDDNDCAIKNHNLPIRHSSFSSFRC